MLSSRHPVPRQTDVAEWKYGNVASGEVLKDDVPGCKEQFLAEGLKVHRAVQQRIRKTLGVVDAKVKAKLSSDGDRVRDLSAQCLSTPGWRWSGDSKPGCGKFGPGSMRPHDPVRVEYEPLRCTLVEVMVPARRVLQWHVTSRAGHVDLATLRLVKPGLQVPCGCSVYS